MNAHKKSTPQSQDLCDLLLFLVKDALPDTTRNEAGKVCSIGVTTRFAFIYHRRGGMRVYLLGKEDDGPVLEELAGSSSTVTVIKRHTMGSDWAKLTPYYLDIESEDGVRGAVPLVSYAASQVKSGNGRRVYLLPSEESDSEMSEGSRTTVEVSRIERDAAARKRCIALFGTTCAVCGFNFEKIYGKIGAGFIHVHHLNPLAMAEGRRKVSPKTDLRPVCPNCHEMLHRQRPPFTIEELQDELKH
jgi:hypothetical protein